MTDSNDLRVICSAESNDINKPSASCIGLIDTINEAIEQSVWHGGEEDYCYFSFLEDQKKAVEAVAKLLGVGIEPRMSMDGENVLWYKLSYK